MVYLTEPKLQGWRAVAVFEDGAQCLIYLGRSTGQVRAGYAAAYEGTLDGEERARVRAVSLECWDGAADAGRWVRKGTLAVPLVEGAANGSRLAAGGSVEEDEPPAFLSFRGPEEPTGISTALPRRRAVTA